MKSVRPVVDTLEMYEQTLGGEEQGQPEYAPLYILRSPENRILSRWQLAEDDKFLIHRGADIFLELHVPLGVPYPPTSLRVAFPSANIEQIRANMRLDDQMELKLLNEDMQRKAEEFQAAQKRWQDKWEAIFPPETKPQASDK